MKILKKRKASYVDMDVYMNSKIVTTSASKTSSDMKLMLYERKNQLSDHQSNHLCANSVVRSKNSAVLVLLVTQFNKRQGLQQANRQKIKIN